MSAYLPGTSNLDYELKPPQLTAPAGRTRPDTPDDCGAAFLGLARPRGISCGIQFFCITPIQAALNILGDLSRHLSRLDKSENLLHTIRDRGDAEA